MRTRLALNYKGVKYTESFISYPDITPLLKSFNVPPLEGVAPYTLPAIQHRPSISEETSGVMNNSLPIALYLDKRFPAPKYSPLFPSSGSYALTLAVQDIISRAAVQGRVIIIPKIVHRLDLRGADYFRRTRKQWFGCDSLDEISPHGEDLTTVWSSLTSELDVLSKMLRGPDGKTGPFLEGDQAGYADFVVVAFLTWFECADRADWEKLVSIGSGELKRLWDACLPWLEGQGEEL